MLKYRVLIVDDDEELVKTTCKSLRDIAGIEVHTASNLEEGRAEIKENFFNVAFVDIQLVRRGRNIDGKILLSDLAEKRPACMRILLTQYPDAYREDFFDLLHPVAPIIHGAVDKQSYRDRIVDVLKELGNQWLQSPIKINGVKEITSCLNTRIGGASDVAITDDEVDYLVSTILGQGAKTHRQSEHAITTISLDELPGGRSRSVVYLGRPETKLGKKGIWCVLKIGPREEAEEEIQRYSWYVRLLLSLNRRVEQLGHVLGDSLGAICYSFAGQSPEGVTTLHKCFENEDERASKCIKKLFSTKAQEWYSQVAQEDDLGAFMYSAYKLEPRSIMKQVHAFAERIAPKIGGRMSGSGIIVNGGKIRLPTDILGSGQLRRPFTGCFVHGDLNASNVVMASDGRAFFIDYARTGFGPATLDFAALHSSLRLASCVKDRPLSELLGDLPLEHKLWNLVAKGNRLPPVRPDVHEPYWLRISKQMIKSGKTNFPKLTGSEHVTTCLLWALRVIRLTRLTEGQRLRILIWMSALVDALESEER